MGLSWTADGRVVPAEEPSDERVVLLDHELAVRGSLLDDRNPHYGETSSASRRRAIAPAAASMDQFDSYADRGNAFIAAVARRMGQDPAAETTTDPNAGQQT